MLTILVLPLFFYYSSDVGGLGFAEYETTVVLGLIGASQLLFESIYLTNIFANVRPYLIMANFVLWPLLFVLCTVQSFIRPRSGGHIWRITFFGIGSLAILIAGEVGLAFYESCREL